MTRSMTAVQSAWEQAYPTQPRPADHWAHDRYETRQPEGPYDIRTDQAMQAAYTAALQETSPTGLAPRTQEHTNEAYHALHKALDDLADLTMLAATHVDELAIPREQALAEMRASLADISRKRALLMETFGVK